MAPQLDMLESEVILAEFLHEMDALDQLQSLEALCFPPEPECAPIIQEQLDQKQTKPYNSQETPKPVPRKRRSTSWLRRKQELHALRNESTALETLMASLQMQRSACQPISDTLTEDQAMWKSVAAIAKQARQDSQDESVRLKNELQMCARGFEMLQAQLITAESFRQQLEGNRLAFANSFRIGMISSQRLCFDDSGIYELLEQRINARLHELDSIVRETCHLPTGGFTENVQVCREDASTTVVEFQHVRLLPFGGDATASTIWDIINMGGLVAKENTYVARSASDMVGLVSRHVIPLGNMASVSVDVHTVIKRVADATGMVALIESHSEWSIHHPTAPGSRYSTEERGWVVVNEHPLQLSGE